MKKKTISIVVVAAALAFALNLATETSYESTVFSQTNTTNGSLLQ